MSNKTVEITKKDLNKAFWKWTWLVQVNYNYERMQATGFTNAISHILEKLYGHDKEGLSNALQRHLNFFNTEPSLGGAPILGAVIAMEEEKADPNTDDIPDEVINNFKTGLMGPLAGIGDTLWQGTLIPILLSFTLPFASQGNIVMGPLLFFILHFSIMIFISYWLFKTMYQRGRDGILEIMQSGLVNRIMKFTGVLGGVVLGALAAQYVQVSCPIVLNLGSGTELALQTGVLDELVLGLLPFALVMFTYYLINKKQFSSTKVMMILILIGAVFGSLGILA